jgi:putative transposase
MLIYPQETEGEGIWSPTKHLYLVYNAIGYIKGKNAISIARNFMGRRGNFSGENFWARG